MTSRSRAAAASASRRAATSASRRPRSAAASTPAALRALHPRLGGEQVGAGGAAVSDGVAAGVARRGDGVRGLAQDRLAADAVRQLAGELLAGGLLGALAQRADALEAEGEGRSLHVRLIARPAGT